MKSGKGQDVDRELTGLRILILNIVRNMRYDESEVRDQWD